MRLSLSTGPATTTKLGATTCTARGIGQDIAPAGRAQIYGRRVRAVRLTGPGAIRREFTAVAAVTAAHADTTTARAFAYSTGYALMTQSVGMNNASCGYLQITQDSELQRLAQGRIDRAVNHHVLMDRQIKNLPSRSRQFTACGYGDITDCSGTGEIDQ